MKQGLHLALWISKAPHNILDVLNKTATRHTLRIFLSYGTIQDKIFLSASSATCPSSNSLRASGTRGNQCL